LQFAWTLDELKGIKGEKLWYLMAYSFLGHTADVKFRASGESLEEMFVFAAEAFNETVRGKIKILEQKEKIFEVEGGDNMSLLYNFLEEFLVLLEKDDFLVSKVKEIEVGEGKLKCVVVGDVAGNYKFTNDVKAVTYSEMFVREKEKEWECQVVLDV